MTYEDWIKIVPIALTGDPLWKVEAYRLALFAVDVAWPDVTKLMQDKRTLGLASQLYEAVGSVAANLSEGYSRGSGKDRVRFYEYSLGSGRESRTWYYGAATSSAKPSSPTASTSTRRSSACCSR
jgi:four helix bundle protein